MLTYLKNEIKKKKEMYNANRMNVRCNGRNYHLLAAYKEKRIGEELIQHGVFCILDETIRTEVGERAVPTRLLYIC